MLKENSRTKKKDDINVLLIKFILINNLSIKSINFIAFKNLIFFSLFLRFHEFKMIFSFPLAEIIPNSLLLVNGEAH